MRQNPIFTSRKRHLTPPKPATPIATTKYVEEEQRSLLFNAVFHTIGVDLYNYIHGSMWPDPFLRICNRYTRPNPSVARLAERIHSEDAIAWEVVNSLLIDHSAFFRGNTEMWQHIEDYLILHRSEPLRTLSLGCSHGQETFSALILAHEAGATRVTAEGWDVNRKIIERLNPIKYPSGAIRSLAPALVSKYFYLDREINGDCYRPLEFIRERARFFHRDILDDSFKETPQYDIVLCNNVKMHLTEQGRIYADIRASDLLHDGGLYVTDSAYPPPKPSTLGLQATSTPGVWIKSM